MLQRLEGYTTRSVWSVSVCECFKRDFYEHESRVQRLSMILELACSWPIGTHLRPADVYGRYPGGTH